jgi:hypothetical protein
MVIFIICKKCGFVFYLCRKCYRGHRYCSNYCRIVAQQESHRKAQLKYQKSPKGKKTRSIAAKKRRRKGQIPIRKNNVIDESTTVPFSMPIIKVSPPNMIAKCHFCGYEGKIVKTFPSRERGKSYYEQPTMQNCRC